MCEGFTKVRVRYWDDAEQTLKMPTAVPAEHAASFACAIHQLIDEKGRRIVTASEYLSEEGAPVGSFESRFKERTS